MRAQTRVITTFLLALVGLGLIFILFIQAQSLLSKGTQEADAYVKFARLTQLNLKPLRGEYNIYQNNLYVKVLLVNEGTEPIYYRSPILGVVRMKDENGNESATDVYLSVDNSTGAFYPSITYKLSGLTILDNNQYRPYRVELLINGITISVDLFPVDWPYSKNVYTCNTCGFCQHLVDNLPGPAVILVSGDVAIDQSPCITFSGDGNGLILDCSGHTFSGTGSEIVFKFQEANNYTLRTCNVASVSRAIEVNGESHSLIRGISVSNASYAIYLYNPLHSYSYAIDVQDLMYNDKKLFYFKPGYGSSFEPFKPLAVWVYGFTGGVSVNVGGEVLEKAYPLLSILSSSNVTVSDFNMSVPDPYGIIVLDSSDVNILRASLTLNSSAYGIYINNSTNVFVDDVNVSGISTIDLLVTGSDAKLGDVRIK